MFVFDFIFHFKRDSENFDLTLTDYLCALSGNNQIIFETLNISGSEFERTARVSVPHRDSLDEKYDNLYVKNALQRLSAYLAEPVEKQYVGEDFTYCDDFATGGDTKCYVLAIHPKLTDIAPICEGNSHDHIPYYLLPALSEETAAHLISWKNNYAAYDQLFYVTGIGEIRAHKMLANVSSELNRKGLSVCRMLENEWKKPVYYYLYRFYGKQPSKCPVCGGDWKQGEDSFFDYKCDKCKIVTDKTPNES